MFNLLPDNLKEKIRSEYYLRLIVVVFVFVIGIQVSFLIFLFPSWLISMEKEKEIISQSEISGKSLQDSQIDLVNSAINTINAKLRVINTTLEYPRVVSLIDSILSQKTGSIHIDGITYISQGVTTGKMVIAGTSTTRESLVVFAKKLEESRLFSSVDLPISNFAKDKDIDFSISMTIKQ